MSFQFEDLLAGRNQVQKKQADVVQLQARSQVARTLKDLQTDPRWNLLAQHIVAELEPIEKQIEYQKERLSGGEFLEPKEYGQIKMKLADNAAYARGLNRGLSLMAELIRTGEIAKEKLDANG